MRYVAQRRYVARICESGARSLTTEDIIGYLKIIVSEYADEGFEDGAEAVGAFDELERRVAAMSDRVQKGIEPSS